MAPPAPIPGACWISLTKGLFTLIDKEDYPIVSMHAWQAHSAGYATGIIDGRRIYLHQFLLRARYTDHVDGDRLNNRRHNLRSATYSQNSANTRLRRDNSTGLRGVRYMPREGRCKRWCARIAQLTIGYYATAGEAAQAYNQAALAKWGEFARLNAMKDT